MNVNPREKGTVRCRSGTEREDEEGGGVMVIFSHLFVPYFFLKMGSVRTHARTHTQFYPTDLYILIDDRINDRDL